MANVMDSVGKRLEKPDLDPRMANAGKLLLALVEADAYVGEVYSLGYEEALVQIHDHHRRRVGGIPALSFLMATRLAPVGQVDVREEDSSVVLLRALDSAELPNSANQHPQVDRRDVIGRHTAFVRPTLNNLPSRDEGIAQVPVTIHQ